MADVMGSTINNHNNDSIHNPLLVGYSYLYFSERRHDSQGEILAIEHGDTLLTNKDKDTANGNTGNNNSSSNSSSWRIRERVKTAAGLLTLCLHIGVDPPDVVKTSPCARLECWIDPYSMSTQRALDTIGHALKQQYEAWQPRARYKLLLDPAVEAAKKLCCALRRSTRDDRILFHYNGHGVPKPTSSGEIWVFNKSYTQYIPVSLYDLQSWLGSPCIYVYDCSAAGNIVTAFDRFAKQRDAEAERRRQSGNTNQQSSVRGSHPPSAANSSASTPTSTTQPSTVPEYSAPMSDCIQLAACSANEVLPMNPTLPADLFSACLTTPISMALRWFVLQTPMLGVNISPDDVMKPPGSLAERRSPLGEINWIFTAVTDTIAWSVLPPALFKRLFRQDIMVATMFRNFLLADRIMRHYKCTPVSSPALPSTHQHPMWQAWDLVVDMFVMQMPALLEAAANDAPLPYRSSTFFAEQLTAFEVWLKHGQVTRQPPEQLPIILQVLLSQVHRMRALVLLSRFLDLGPWAVNQALSVGIFPYVLKLLQSSAVELRPVLIFIWARMLAVDHECAQDLVKGEGYLYFVNVLSPNQPTPPQQQVAASLSEHRAMCAFVLSMICRHTDVGRRACLNAGVMTMCVSHTNDPDYLLRQWCCLCLGQLWRGFPDAKWIAIRDNIHERLLDMLEDTVPEVRAAALYALSMLIGDLDMTEQIIHIEHNITVRALGISEDASPLVRRELVCLLSVVIHRYPEQFQNAASALLEESKYWSVLSNNTSGVDDKTWRRRRDRTRPSSDSASTVFNALTLADIPPMTTSTNNDTSNNSSSNGSNGSIQDTMYGGAWCTLLVLSVDPYAPVAIYASAVVDYIHDQLYDSGQITAAMASIPGSPASGYDIPTTPTSVRSLNLPSYSSYSIHDTPLSNSGINTTGQGHFEKRSTPATQRITSTLKRSASGTMSALRNIYNFGYGLTSGTATTAAGHTHPHHHHHYQQQQQHQQHHSLSSTATNPMMTTPATPVAAALAKSNNTRSHSESASRDITNPPSSISDWFSDTTSGDTTAVTNGSSIRRQLSLNRPWSTLGNSASTTSLNELALNQHRLPSDNVGPMMARIKEEQALTIDHLPLTSKLFDWCCTYFLEPQIRTAENLEPGSKGYNARSWRRTRNEQVLQETVPYHEEAATVPWNKSFGMVNEEMNAQLLRFHTYAPHLLACDGQHTISVWDWEQRIRLNSFLNSNNATSRITSMDLINEEDLALLLVGSDDGAVRLYRNYDTPCVELVSSWRALIDKVPSSYNSGLVTEWHQNSGTLLVGGDARVVRVWNAEREVCLENIYTHSDSCVTCLTSDPMSNHIFVAGCGDGVIRVFDRRNPPRESLVISWNEHPAWILDVHQSQNRPHDLLSASMSGDIKIWDVRQTDSILTIDADPNGLTAFAAHDHTPVMVSSGTHGVNVWDYYGRVIGTPRMHGGILGQRHAPPPPAALTFHPRRPLLAISGTDRPISIVGCEIRKPLLAEPLLSTIRMIDA